MLVMTSRNCIESSWGNRNYRTAALSTIPSVASLQSTVCKSPRNNISLRMLNSSLRSSGENYRECRENVSFYDIYVQ